MAGVELGLDLASQPAFRALIRRWVAPPERLRSSMINGIKHWQVDYR